MLSNIQPKHLVKVQSAKGHLTKLEVVVTFFALCGIEKVQNKFKLVFPVLAFKVNEDVCCTIIPLCKKNNLKK